MTSQPPVRVCLAPLALLFLMISAPGCSGTSSPSAGLRSCFDTGQSIVCVQSDALSTADKDVDHDGTADHFVCADDDDDGHDRDRDRDHSGAVATDGDEDHDGVDDDLDCDHRGECHSLSNEANEDEHHGDNSGPGDEHDGGDHDGHDEHPETGCLPPKLPPPAPGT